MKSKSFVFSVKLMSWVFFCEINSGLFFQFFWNIFWNHILLYCFKSSKIKIHNFYSIWVSFRGRTSCQLYCKLFIILLIPFYKKPHVYISKSKCNNSLLDISRVRHTDPSSHDCWPFCINFFCSVNCSTHDCWPCCAKQICRVKTAKTS